MKTKENFNLKRHILLDSKYDNISVDSCESDDNGGLNLVMTLITDDMLINMDSDKEMFEFMFDRMLFDDGQIVRFCDYIIRLLSKRCTSFFYENSDDPINLEHNCLFDDETAEFNIPKIIYDLSERNYNDALLSE